MKGLTQKEVVSVIRMAETARNQAMIAIAYRHGMRVSEVCGLKMTDVDLKNSEITIRRLKGSLKTTRPYVTNWANLCFQRETFAGMAYRTRRSFQPICFRFSEIWAHQPVAVLPDFRSGSRGRWPTN